MTGSRMRVRFLLFLWKKTAGRSGELAMEQLPWRLVILMNGQDIVCIESLGG